MKSYSELILLPDYYSRLEYLRLYGKVGELNDEVNRYLNQRIYSTSEWRHVRNMIILRDYGCDLAIPGLQITGRPSVHHINPLSLDDVLNRSPKLFDPENLILTSHDTHELIHFGFGQQKREDYVERKPGDTKLW